MHSSPYFMANFYGILSLKFGAYKFNFATYAMII